MGAFPGALVFPDSASDLAAAEGPDRKSGPLSRFKAADGHGLVVTNIEHGVKFRNLQQVMYLLGQMEQFQLPALV